MSRKTAKNEALPKGWRRTKLGDIYNISASGDLDTKATSLTQDEKHPYPIYSNALTNKGLHSYSSYAKYDEDSITITARGDVGFANHRTTKFMAIGRLLVLKNKVPISNKFVCEYINHQVRFFKETTGVPVDELSSFASPDAATKAATIQSGDIIFAASGETTAEIGKAIAFVGPHPAVAGGDTVIFRDHGQEPAYLVHALNDADATRQKARLGKGQSVVHIHVPELFQVEVPLPPLHEQRKIVKILATWDTAIEKTKALAEQYRIQKRGLMQKLLTGKWRIQLGDN